MKFNSTTYFLLLLITTLSFSCSHPEQSNSPHKALINQLDHEINIVVDSINNHESLNFLIENGFTEIGLKIIEDSLSLDNSESTVIRFAKMFIDNGSFEKGLNLLANIQPKKNRFDYFNLKLSAALNRMDTSLSRPLLDSLHACLVRDYSIEHEIIYLNQKGYHLHNGWDCFRAIDTYNQALDTLNKYKIKGGGYLSRLYHRIGNSYNDLYRHRLNKLDPTDTFYNKTLEYYQKEWDIINNEPVKNLTRIALNLQTIAILMKSKPRTDFHHFYRESMGYLFIAADEDYVITRNPTYISTNLNQLAGNYDCKKHPNCRIEVDSLININQTLINQQAILSLSSANGLDVKYCNPSQGNQKGKINHRISDSLYKNNPLELLNLSTKTKYSTIKLIPTIKNIFGDDAKKAAKYWALLHEIKLLGTISHNEYYIAFAEKNLKQLNVCFAPVVNCLKSQSIDNYQLNQLIKYCKKNNSVIMDYQMSHKYFITTIIDSSGIKNSYVLNDSGAITQNDIEDLKRLMFEKKIGEYEKLAYELSQKLKLNDLRYKEVVICPDEYLNQLPFDALVIKNRNSKRWKDLLYVANYVNIKFIPNIQTMFANSKANGEPEINILYSEKDNTILPNNEDLISYLKSNYSTHINAKNSSQILHIIAHAQNEQSGNIKFVLNNDTISILTNGLKPDIAILHGCHSGTGNFIYSEGYMSLSRMFLYNGSKAVISSIWDADNASSVELFKEFYKHLKSGECISKSLYQAKIYIKNNPNYVEWSDPFYWANWRMLGEDLVYGKN